MKMPTGAIMLLACAAFPFAPLTPADPFDRPGAAEVTLWPQVYAGLAQRADRGDADAARLALEMLRAAPQLYGRRFEATPSQLTLWTCRARGLEPPCAEAPAA